MLIFLCPECGTRSRKEVRQVERDEACVYVCLDCNETCGEVEVSEVLREVEAELGNTGFYNPVQFFEACAKYIERRKRSC